MDIGRGIVWSTPKKSYPRDPGTPRSCPGRHLPQSATSFIHAQRYYSCQKAKNVYPSELDYRGSNNNAVDGLPHHYSFLDQSQIGIRDELLVEEVHLQRRYVEIDNLQRRIESIDSEIQLLDYEELRSQSSHSLRSLACAESPRNLPQSSRIESYDNNSDSFWPKADQMRCELRKSLDILEAPSLPSSQESLDVRTSSEISVHSQKEELVPVIISSPRKQSDKRTQAFEVKFEDIIVLKKVDNSCQTMTEISSDTENLLMDQVPSKLEQVDFDEEKVRIFSPISKFEISKIRHGALEIDQSAMSIPTLDQSARSIKQSTPLIGGKERDYDRETAELLVPSVIPPERFQEPLQTSRTRGILKENWTFSQSHSSKNVKIMEANLQSASDSFRKIAESFSMDSKRQSNVAETSKERSNSTVTCVRRRISFTVPDDFGSHGNVCNGSGNHGNDLGNYGKDDFQYGLSRLDSVLGDLKQRTNQLRESLLSNHTDQSLDGIRKLDSDWSSDEPMRVEEARAELNLDSSTRNVVENPVWPYENLAEDLADEFYRKTLMRKGVKSLKWVLTLRDIENARADRDHVRKEQARCWQVWRRRLSERRSDRLRELFAVWRTRQDAMKRYRLLTVVRARRQARATLVTWRARTRDVITWPLITRYHRKRLLYRYLTGWRRFHHNQQEQRLQLQVAIEFHETSLKQRTFGRMVMAVKFASAARELSRRRLLSRVLSSWQQACVTCRLDRLHDNSTAHAHWRDKLVHGTFARWRCRLKTRRAKKHSRNAVWSQCFALWKARFRCRQAEYRLVAMETDWRLVRRVLTRWRTAVAEATQERRRGAFITWRRWAENRGLLRLAFSLTSLSADVRLRRQTFLTWRQYLLHRRHSRQQVVRRFAYRWLQITSRRAIQRQVLELQHSRNLLIQKQCFETLKWELDRRREMDKYHSELLDSYEKEKLRRLFNFWRQRRVEREVIEPLRRRIERKRLTPCFDAWRGLLWRRKYNDLMTMRNERRMVRKSFRNWKNEFRVQRLLKANERKKKLKVFCYWQIFVTERLHLKKEHDLKLMKRSFEVWISVYRCARIEARIQEMEDRRSRCLKITTLRTWFANVGIQKRIDARKIRAMKWKSGKLHIRQYFHFWWKLSEMNKVAKNYDRMCQMDNLSGLLLEWYVLTRNERLARDLQQQFKSRRLKLLFLLWKARSFRSIIEKRNLRTLFEFWYQRMDRVKLESLVLRCGQVWLKRSRIRAGMAEIADVFRAEKDRLRVCERFVEWRESCDRLSLAGDLGRVRVLDRFWREWRKFRERRDELRRRGYHLKDQVARRTVRTAWRKWREARISELLLLNFRDKNNLARLHQLFTVWKDAAHRQALLTVTSSLTSLTSPRHPAFQPTSSSPLNHERFVGSEDEDLETSEISVIRRKSDVWTESERSVYPTQNQDWGIPALSLASDRHLQPRRYIPSPQSNSKIPVRRREEFVKTLQNESFPRSTFPSRLYVPEEKLPTSPEEVPSFRDNHSSPVKLTSAVRNLNFDSERMNVDSGVREPSMLNTGLQCSRDTSGSELSPPSTVIGTERSHPITRTDCADTDSYPDVHSDYRANANTTRFHQASFTDRRAAMGSLTNTALPAAAGPVGLSLYDYAASGRSYDSSMMRLMHPYASQTDRRIGITSSSPRLDYRTLETSFGTSTREFSVSPAKFGKSDISASRSETSILHDVKHSETSMFVGKNVHLPKLSPSEGSPKRPPSPVESLSPTFYTPREKLSPAMTPSKT